MTSFSASAARFAGSLLAGLVVLLVLSHSAAAADWTYQTLTPPASDSFFPASGAPSIAADAAGRTTVAWTDGNAGNERIVERTRTAAGVWSAERTLSAPGEMPVAMSGSVNGALVSVTANGVGDMAAVWQTCLVGAFGMADDQQCGLRWALRARGTTTWTSSSRVLPADAPLNQNTNPSVALNDEGDLTVAWEFTPDRMSHREIHVRTFRNEQAGYVGEPERTLESSATPNANDTSSATHVLLATRTDGSAVALWRRYQSFVGPGGACSEIRSAVQEPAGTWRAAALLNDVPCVGGVTGGFGHALARDGDDVLAVYGNLVDDGTVNTRAAVVARRILADGTRSAPATVGTGVFPWNDMTAGYGWPVANPLAVGPGGDAALVADAETAAADDTDRYTKATWNRAAGSATWTRAEPAPAITFAPYEAGADAAQVTMEDDGTATALWHERATPQEEVRVIRRPPGSPWTAPTVLSSTADTRWAPVLASRGAGPPVAAWVGASLGSSMETAVLGGVVNAAPVASFVFAPGQPTAGQAVTFTSTSTDPDGTVVAQEWDLDDDGTFGDASGPQAVGVFGTAGTYTVELRVTDDRGEEDVTSRQVTVGTAPPSTTPDGPTPPDAPKPDPAPAGFVVVSQRDTTGQRTVPAVVGRSLDDAHDKIDRALQYADIKDVRVISAAKSLPKRPGGGRWRVGDVIGQTPAAKRRLTTSTTRQVAVQLRFWAGAKGDRTACNDLRTTLKKDELATSMAVLKAAGCGSRPDLILVAATGVAEPTVRSIAKDGDVTVSVPTDLSKLDLRTWRGTGVLGSRELGPVAGDFSLTAGQANTLGVVLRDRVGRRAVGAKVRVDMHEVGGKDVTRQTDGAGAFATTVTPQRPGTIHVLSEWEDAAREKIYGYAAFEVRKRTDRTLVTAVGKTFTLNTRTGRYDLTGSPSRAAVPVARAAGIPEFFAAVASCFQGLAGAAQLAGSATEQVIRATSNFGVSVLSLWRGQDRGATPGAARSSLVTQGLWRLGPNGVVAAGGGNVVAAGGGNVVAAGGGNVVAGGGGNVIAAGGGNLISDNGLGVIAAGGGNLVVLPDGARVVAAGGGNVVAAGGGNVVAAGGGNVVAAGGGN